jgi:hypothetical protein
MKKFTKEELKMIEDIKKTAEKTLLNSAKNRSNLIKLGQKIEGRFCYVKRITFEHDGSFVYHFVFKNPENGLLCTAGDGQTELFFNVYTTEKKEKTGGNFRGFAAIPAAALVKHFIDMQEDSRKWAEDILKRFEEKKW